MKFPSIAATQFQSNRARLWSFLRWACGGDAAAVGAVLLFTAGIYYKPWLQGTFFLSDDVAAYSAPVYRYAAERLRAGQLPHWNPYLFAGTPFLVNPQAGTFYPPTWLNIVLPIDVGVTVLAVGHLFIAALLMYWFCRVALGVGPFAAFVAGVSFAHTGHLAAHYVHTPQLLSATWLPGVICSYWQGRATGRRGWFVAGGVFLGLSILAGGVQSVFVICLCLVLLGLYDMICPIAAASRGGWLTRLAPMWALGIIAINAAGVGAAQLVATLRFIPHSIRSGGMGLEEASEFSLHPLVGLLLLICPHLFGHAGTVYWGIGNQHELTVYPGMLTVTVGTIAAVWSLRQKHLRIFALLALAGFLLACGHYTPIFRAAYRVLPGLAYFRAPARFVLLFGFAMSALCAVGLHELLLGRRSVRGWLLTSALAIWSALAATAIWFVTRDDFLNRLVQLGMPSRDRDEMIVLSQIISAHRVGTLQHDYTVLFLWTGFLSLAGLTILRLMQRRPGLAKMGVALLLTIDLLTFNRGLAQSARAGAGEDYLSTRDWIEFLRTRGNDYRCQLSEPWLPNTAMLHDLAVADGYDAFLPQLRHHELVSRGKETGSERKLQQLFAVGYQGHYSTGTARGVEAFRSVREPMVILQNPDVPPRAHVVFDAQWVSTGSEALSRVLSPDFDPYETVILEADESASTVPSVRQPGESSVRMTVSRPEHLEFEIDSHTSGWLVVADAYWPTWEARVDGNRVPILRANHYFRAVAVSAGKSMVEMRYVDHGVWLGALVSTASALAQVSWILVHVFKIKSEQNGATENRPRSLN